MYSKYVELRDALGVNDATVARATNIPRSTFTEWKNGRSKPKLEKLLKLSNYFGCSINELIQE